MKTYLLLRSNKQTGPYTFDELLTLGLRAQDLLWVEGKSASWRYPSELDEFRAHVPVPVMESMLDRKSEPDQEDAGPLHHGTATVTEPVPEKEQFHFHPRIRAAADPLASKETMHFHPRLNGGSGSLEQKGDGTQEFPTLSRFMQTSLGQSQPGTQETIGGPAMLPVADASAFYPAKPPADAEDEVPSLALQAAPEQVGQPKISPAELTAAPRINVTLPTAAADKTMVIIHPREQHPEAEVSEPAERLQESKRRPVLEFLEDTTDGSTEGHSVEQELAPLPPEAVPEIQPFDNQKTEDTQLIAEPLSQSRPAAEAAMIPEPVLESYPAMDVPLMTEPAVEHTTPLSPLRSAEPDIQPASADTDASYALPSVRPKNSEGMLQKIAVAAAIISLVAVAALIANTVFNPNAYNYETKSSPTVPVRKLPARQTGSDAVTEPGKQADPGRTVSGDSEQSVNSETTGSPQDNQAKPAVRKIE